MTRSLVAVVAGVVSLAVQPGLPEPAPADAIESVREIPIDTLRDLAIAVYDARHPIIYFNPTRMQNIGPNLAAFFMAHEYGHIHFRHTRASALGSGSGQRDVELQSRELEADCFAAAALAVPNRPAVDAAVRYFSRQGPFRFDVEHPTGAQRAAKILSCLPPTASPERPALLVASRPTARAPRVDSSRVAFTLHTEPLTGGQSGKNVRFRIGPVTGTFSNLGLPSSILVRDLAAGTYDYQVEVDLFFLDDMLQLNPSGTVQGRGILTVRDGAAFQVEWNPGGSVVLVEGH